MKSVARSSVSTGLLLTPVAMATHQHPPPRETWLQSPAECCLDCLTTWRRKSAFVRREPAFFDSFSFSCFFLFLILFYFPTNDCLRSGYGYGVTSPKVCGPRTLFCIFSSKTILMKKVLRETQTLGALPVVRLGHRLPAVTNPQTGPITIHCTAAS